MRLVSTTLRNAAVATSFALLSLACAVDDATSIPTAPAVQGLDRQTVTVGEPLVVFGQNFLSPDEGRTRVVFEGQFIPASTAGAAAPENVPELALSPIYDGTFIESGDVGGAAVLPGTSLLRINRFGPFGVPFGAGDRPGTFKGTLRAENIYRDGTVEVGGPTPVSLEVGRSVAITRLAPIIGVDRDGDGKIVAVRTAECDAPALRGLGGMGYVLEVKAVGFKPASFRYQFTNVNGKDVLPEIVHIVEGDSQTDVVGDPTKRASDPVIVLNPLTEEEGWAIAGIRVTAVDDRGDPVYTALPITVVRPVAYHYDGARELAEYYEPTVVSGPFTGGIGTEIAYSETVSEDRQQGVSVGISKDWSRATGQEESESWEEGVETSSEVSTTNASGVDHSESKSSSETIGEDYSTSAENSVAVGTETGSSWSWNTAKEMSAEEYSDTMKELSGEVSAEVSASVTGEGSIPGLAKVSGTVGTTVGTSVGMSTGTTSGARTGTSESVGNSMEGSDSSSQVFGSATSDSRSKNFSGTYAFDSQDTISSSTAKTEAKGESRAFSVGGSGSLSESFSEGASEQWESSWVSSKGQSSSLQISSKVPRGRCAVVYRQTVRWVRRAQLYNYDLCGVRTLMGEMNFNEWTWTPSIALGEGDNCDRVPSGLPPAACFVACE